MSTPAALQLFKPMTYEQYRLSPLWRARRAAALLRAGNSCALDATHTEDLEVLHNTRERLGEELDRDLIVLCASCRQLVARTIPGEPGEFHQVPHVLELDGAQADEECDAAEQSYPESASDGPPWRHLNIRRPSRR